jgi:hypothetical protein
LEEKEGYEEEGNRDLSVHFGQQNYWTLVLAS